MVRVLAGVNLEVEPGTFTGIIGPNGAGKTTLLLALAGLAPRLTGGELSGDVQVTGRVGMVFQEVEGQLFNPTVELEVAWGLENLAVPRDEMRARIDWALSVTGLSDQRSRAPGTLSGGQQKRLMLAVTLAMRPDVLLLDEPVSSLDPKGRAEVLAAIADLRARQAMTVIMAENHADAVAAFADRVLVLHEGSIARAGTPHEVFIDTEWLDSIGAPVPPAARLARALGRDDFVTAEGAAAALGVVD
jgi:energy-coupling factor transporter ATP-binding protein EcfA2